MLINIDSHNPPSLDEVVKYPSSHDEVDGVNEYFDWMDEVLKARHREL